MVKSLLIFKRFRFLDSFLIPYPVSNLYKLGTIFKRIESYRALVNEK